MSGQWAWLGDIAPAVGMTVLVRGAVIVAAAAVAARLLVRASAATRYAVWALAFVALMAVPFAGTPLPRWVVAAPVAGPAVAHPAASAVADPPVQLQTALAPSEFLPSPAVDTASDEWFRSLPGAAVLVWLLGATLLLVRLAIHSTRATAIARRGTTLPGLGMTGVRVVQSDETSVPLVCGARRPTIVLPASAAGWSSELLTAALAHELAHVHRRDYLFHIVGRAVVACYWANPLVWMAFRRLVAERERACDDRALSGLSAPEYASHLVEVAHRMREEPALAHVALAMADPQALRERIRGLLAPEADRRPVMRSQYVPLGLGLAVIAIPVATIQLHRPPTPDPFLLTALVDPGPAVRMRAAWGLGEFESRASVPALIERLDDPEPGVRGVVVWALGEIKDRRPVDQLSRVLEADGDPLVREMAAVALGEIGSAAAVGPLVEAVRREADLLPAVLWSLGEIRHRSAAAASRELRFGAPEVGPWKEDGMLRRGAERLPDGDVKERVLVLYDVGRHRDAHGLGTALALLTAPEPLVRASAAWALGRVGAMAAVDPLIGAMRDPDVQVRALAVWALDEINPTRAARR